MRSLLKLQESLLEIEKLPIELTLFAPQDLKRYHIQFLLQKYFVEKIKEIDERLEEYLDYEFGKIVNEQSFGSKIFLTVYHALLKIFESFEVQVAVSKVG